MDLSDPTAFALGVTEALRREGVAHALYGGLLLAAYGEARETKDADLAVVRADARTTAALLERSLGIHCLVAFERQVFGGLSVSRITLVDADELNSLDLVEPLEAAYAQRALERSSTSTLRGQEIRVLSPEDFVIFKVLSTRELDLADAASVVRSLGPDLEAARIEQEVGLLASLHRSHPVRERWDRVRSGRA
jgi:hypothetical protein